ncbi:putative thiamine transport system ATP-binding protein [Palleronia aestuarii]|uniref:Putative thiamine transport system ATP-binding protein n=1 Tax=Palleronia aestuarii TaxID=568105 RepID=A0A2W7NE94_9RHOB|nr:ATP-binding cassette domain-containing protein [Palleronia aestuarii]PZX15064.1 putative thiamine transport system ATP-binding protein [Palleronia aestuarii]
MADGLRLDGIAIDLAGEPLLRIDAEVGPGEVLTVMGRSGAGKSTLLAYLTGTLAPTFEARGRILLGGRDITCLSPDRRRIGILFQDALLFPHLSVGGNLGFGLRGGSRRTRRDRIDAALAEVGLEGFAERDPATLSGGQRARVALQRMLLSDPHALLLDEAFSGLDTDRRDRTRTMVFETARRRALPVIMVTHDEADAKAAGGARIQLG